MIRKLHGLAKRRKCFNDRCLNTPAAISATSHRCGGTIQSCAELLDGLPLEPPVLDAKGVCNLCWCWMLNCTTMFKRNWDALYMERRHAVLLNGLPWVLPPQHLTEPESKRAQVCSDLTPY
eukprot:6249493-Amphidinium_carterae.1